MEIIKPGTPVITKIGEMKALITGVCIRMESVSYEISYFLNGQHTQAWVYRYEIEIDTTQKGVVGLKDFSAKPDNSQFLISI